MTTNAQRPYHSLTDIHTARGYEQANMRALGDGLAGPPEHDHGVDVLAEVERWTVLPGTPYEVLVKDRDADETGAVRPDDGTVGLVVRLRRDLHEAIRRSLDGETGPNAPSENGSPA